MAIIWQCNQAGKRYTVRRAGSSLRLYTNGAFHSQYNPRHLLTGAMWDLLTLPALFVESTPRTILMLGVGGGTAIHQFNRLLAPRKITGIEIDPVHIHVARRYFKACTDNVELIEADATRWLGTNRRRFDVIVDDLFVDTTNDPVRPGPVDGGWLSRLATRAGTRGVIIQNHLSPELARAVVAEHAGTLRKHFSTALVFTVPNYENGILALYRKRIAKVPARRRARERIAEVDARAARRLDFTCAELPLA